MRNVRKIFAVILSLAMLGTMMSISASAVSGSGTDADPYLISNAVEFNLIWDFPAASFRLVNNIVLNYGPDLTCSFSGTLDGDGYIVVGVSGGSLFDNNGTIKNLIVQVDGKMSAPLIGENNGVIENSGMLDDQVKGRATFVGTNNGTIKNCFSTTKLWVDSDYYGHIGGFVGDNTGTIENCLYTGTVQVTGTTYNGGKLNSSVSPFVGENKEASSKWVNDGGTVTGCYYDKVSESLRVLGNFQGASKDPGGASGKSEAALKMRATYEEWDFDNVWAIDSSKNDGYPYLRIDRRFNGKASAAASTKEPTATPDTSKTVTTDQGIGITFGNTAKSDEIKVKLNGSPISFDVPPQIINDRTMVPLRAIFEALGAEVEWNGEKQTILAVKDGVSVLLQVGAALIAKQVDGGDIKISEIDAAPVIVNNRTLVPVRAIAEAFDCTVNWDNETRTVDILG